MATTQYIGSRYVPILANPVEWSSTKSYEPLIIVTHEGNSYTSRQFVPVGIDIANGDYWAMTGNYNAQIELYRRETAQTIETNREYTNAAVEQVNEWLTDAQDTYSAKPFAFGTVADMQTAYSLLYTGAICHTNGFHASGDGGAAWYVISATGVVNGMDVLACGNMFAHLVVFADGATPEMYGAYGDGTADDTASIQKCVNNARIINFNSKTYAVSAPAVHDNCINIPSNTTIYMNNATFAMKGSAAAAYQIINISDVENIVIYGNGFIVGDRNSHSGNAGEWGMGISIFNAKNISISNIKISDCFGDGIYINNGENISIDTCILDNNRRNNISIISCDTCTIENCTLSNPNGTAPESNISVEANTSDDFIKNLVIENCVLIDTHGFWSMYVTTRSNNNTVTIKNCRLDKPFTTGAISGDYNEINILDCFIKCSAQFGTINSGNIPANSYVIYDNVTFSGGAAFIRHEGPSLHNLIIKNSRLVDCTYERLTAYLGGSDISNNYIEISLNPNNVKFNNYVTPLFPANTNNFLKTLNIIPATITDALPLVFYNTYFFNNTVDAARALNLSNEQSVPMGQVYTIFNTGSVRCTIGSSVLLHNKNGETANVVVIPAGKYCNLWNLNHTLYYEVIL